MNITVASINPHSTVLGPYNRYILWVQGCHKRCNGCISTSFQSMEGGYKKSVEEIYEEIAKQDIEGITISGGEPFLQAKALCELVEKVKQKNLGVIIYSGYTLEELKNKHDKYIDYLLDMIDLLIDGEYIQELDDEKAGRGSSNQVFHHLSNRYKYSDYYSKQREYHIFSAGEYMILEGIPDKVGKILFDLEMEEDEEDDF